MNSRLLAPTLTAATLGLVVLLPLQAQPSPASVAPAPAAPAVAPAPTPTADAKGREVLSVDFPDDDIRAILRNVADLFELNVIMPESLKGKATIKLRDVTWRQIFDNLLKPVGYTYVEEGNIIKVVSNETLQQEPMMTDVFTLNYAKAADIAPTITSLIDAATGGKVVVDQRSNSLVVTTRPSRMTQIRSIIERLDRGTEQVMIESKFVEVTEGKIRNIGVNWSSLSGYQVGAGKINQTFERTRGQTSGSSGDTRTNNDSKTSTGSTNGVSSTVSNNQTSGSSTTNSLTSTNGTPTATSNTSITGGLTGSTINGSTSGSSNEVSGIASQTLSNLVSLANTGGTARNLSAVFSASEFSVVLSALSQLQDTKVVSNPTIVTLNNNPATINVGEERPIPSYTYSQERGTYEVSGFTYRPIGIILKVTPQVNAAGTIRLSVDPEVSQSTRDATFQGAAIPIVETRKVSTTVVLKDGYTMGIGGLLRSSANDSSNKIPVLGSLPLVGRLFSSKSVNQESTNLIIFITAKTISSDGAPLEQIFESERVRDLKLRRSDLPGYRDGSDPFLKEPAPPVAPKSDSK